MGKEEQEWEDVTEYVDIIASGYEWICPACEHLQKEIEYMEEVICKECSKKFKTSLPEHAYTYWRRAKLPWLPPLN